MSPRISIGSDEEGHEDRQTGDGEVVIDLPDRLGEGPVVGEVHETAVDGVEEAHARGEEDREREDGVEGQSSDDRAPGQDEERDLGGGVEPEAEENADGVHLPGRVDSSRQWAEEPVHEPPTVELSFELLVVVAALRASRERP